MSLAVARGDQRVRSWGLERKRGNAGKERFKVFGTCIGGSPYYRSGEQHSHQVGCKSARA
jgi:hypothetical protein